MARLLVIDDDAGVRESMARMLRAAGYTVQTATSGEEGFDLARGDAFDVILSDMRMSGLSGHRRAASSCATSASTPRSSS